MTPIADTMCLKIAGAWNPAIVTPSWIAREALGKAPADEFQVGVQVPIGFGGSAAMGLVVPQRFTFEGLSMAVTFDALQFFMPNASNEEAALAFSTAAKTLQLLSHTPIFGFGVNFGYVVEKPNELARESFDCIDQSAEQIPEQHATVLQRTWGAALKLEHHVLNVSCSRAGELVQFDLNHHFEVGGGGKAISLLEKPGLYAALRELSVNFVKKYEEAE